MSVEPTLKELKEKLAEEEQIYAELLEKMDQLSRFHAPFDQDTTLNPLLNNLNKSPAITSVKEKSERKGFRGLFEKITSRFVEPHLNTLQDAISEQREFNSKLIQFMNRFGETINHTMAVQAELSSVLVRFAQRIDQLADAKDRLYASLGNTRTDVILEAMDKRIETARVGMRRLQENVEGIDTSIAITRSELVGLQTGTASNKPAENRGSAFSTDHYVAFEERFRGDSNTLRNRFSNYISFFEGHGPVVDLGCGRGEFLELLKETNVEGKGVDENPSMVQSCKEKGLDVHTGDVFSYLSNSTSNSIGGIFSAQLIEHLPPHTIKIFLEECFRALNSDGRLLIETINPESVTAFISFYRDLTHQKPIHPKTLDFMLRAAGFRDVAIRYTSPVSERARLLSITSNSPNTETLNQNVSKLNALLFGELDYAAIATK